MYTSTELAAIFMKFLDKRVTLDEKASSGLAERFEKLPSEQLSMGNGGLAQFLAEQGRCWPVLSKHLKEQANFIYT